MCIKQSLRCDEKENCRFKSDEDVEMCAKVSKSMIAHCSIKFQRQFLQEKDKEASHEIIIISIVFGAMLTVLVIAFMVNCMRKLMRDHKIIRVSRLEVLQQTAARVCN